MFRFFSGWSGELLPSAAGSEDTGGAALHGERYHQTQPAAEGDSQVSSLCYSASPHEDCVFAGRVRASADAHYANFLS